MGCHERSKIVYMGKSKKKISRGYLIFSVFVGLFVLFIFLNSTEKAKDITDNGAPLADAKTMGHPSETQENQRTVIKMTATEIPDAGNISGNVLEVSGNISGYGQLITGETYIMLDSGTKHGAGDIQFIMSDTSGKEIDGIEINGTIAIACTKLKNGVKFPTKDCIVARDGNDKTTR